MRRQNVPVRVGQISRVDVTLEIGTLTETVTVQSRAELLQTDTADVHTELKAKEITSLPLNQYRNYQTLINLVPGAIMVGMLYSSLESTPMTLTFAPPRTARSIAYPPGPRSS